MLLTKSTPVRHFNPDTDTYLPQYDISTLLLRQINRSAKFQPWYWHISTPVRHFNPTIDKSTPARNFNHATDTNLPQCDILTLLLTHIYPSATFQPCYWHKSTPVRHFNTATDTYLPQCDILILLLTNLPQCEISTLILTHIYLSSKF